MTAYALNTFQVFNWNNFENHLIFSIHLKMMQYFILDHYIKIQWTTSKFVVVTKRNYLTKYWKVQGGFVLMQMAISIMTSLSTDLSFSWPGVILGWLHSRASEQLTSGWKSQRYSFRSCVIYIPFRKPSTQWWLLITTLTAHIARGPDWAKWLSARQDDS